jgi:general secretion pathway protein C
VFVFIGFEALVNRGRFNDNPAMQTPLHLPLHHLWWLRIATFLVAALAAASATVWILKLSAPDPQGQTAALVLTEGVPANPQAVARMLGGSQTSGESTRSSPVDEGGNMASRVKLLGVVAGRSPNGYALMAVDGKPAKPFRVGALVDDSWVLQSVAPRSVTLATRLDGNTRTTLALPKLGTP